MVDDVDGESADVLVFGSLNVDLVCRVPQIARPGETVLGPTYEQLCGGKGANQAVAAALAASRNVQVKMVGAVGNDGFGAMVLANLETMGVDGASIVQSDDPTGAAFIAIDEAGENAITVASGANRTLGAKILEGVSVKERSVLLLQMETPFEGSIAASERVVSGGGLAILNLAPVPVDMTGEILRKLCQSVDWLIVNELELEAAANAVGIEAGTISEMAANLGKALDLGVLATLGKNGVVAAPLREEPFVEPALSIAVEDTTGAGDTFCGVFAASLAERLAVRLAVRRAAIAASLSCRRVGAQTAMPLREEIDLALSAEPL